ncbi:MAG TPA: DHH family phosphoesterase [Candidatus Saccharimonadales bacterium]
MYSEAADIAALIDQAHNIVILQADNPDGDSLGSALALEQILGDLGKEPYLYCGVDMPAHLKYLPGWDRVSNELPSTFDLSIIVDTSSSSLFEQATKTNAWTQLASKPAIILDHHQAVENTISFARVVVNAPAVATGEVIYELSRQLEWPLNTHAMNAVAVSILSDSLGLMTDATTARSIHVIAELVEAGVKLPQIENLRRELNRKSPELTRYKGELLQRIVYHNDNKVATVTIPWDEIEKYSPEYNPSVLVLDEMRMTTDTAVAVAFKTYPDGKITGKIRCNYGFPIGAELAENFGGGGHPYASGFKVKDGRSLSDIEAACVAKASELLNKVQSTQDEVI